METTEDITKRGTIQGANGASYALGSQEATNYLLGNANSASPAQTVIPQQTPGQIADAAAMARQNGATNVNAAMPEGKDFGLPKTDTVQSSALVGGRTVADIMKRRSELEQQVINANKPSQLETDLTSQLNTSKQLSRKAQLDYMDEARRLQETSGVTKAESAGFLSETSRRYADESARMGIGLSGLADALTAEVGKRQVNIDGAKSLLQADKDTVSLLADLQKLTKPDIIGTPNVNESTGEVTVFQQDPQTGAITSSVVGNVGASKKYIQSGIRKNEKGEDVLWGRKSDNTIEQTVLGPGEVDTQVADFGGEKWVIDKQGNKIRLLGSNSTGFLDQKERITLETNYRKEFTGLPVVKEAISVRQSNSQITSAYNQALQAGKNKESKAAADQVLVVAFNKMIDPASVVREGEFARSTEGQSLINRLKGKADSVVNGGVGLTDEDRNSIVKVTKNLYSDYVRNHNAEALRYRGLADQQGLDGNNVADFLPTAGVIDTKNAREGDILILDNKPFIKKGNKMEEVVSKKSAFNSVGGDTNLASIKGAISSIESGNNYSALSPVNRNGLRAYGKYQILASNIPQWTKEALGVSMTPEQFLKDPQAQEKTAEFQLGKIYQQYGNADDVASVWFSGRPMRGNNSKDVTGTSVPQYVANFRKALSKQA